MQKLIKHATENSTYYLTLTAQAYNNDDELIDIEPSDITSITWTLTRNSDGQVINWREDVSIIATNPITIKLSGDDLPYLGLYDYLIITINWIYVDSDGDTAYLKQGYALYVDKTEPEDIISCSGGQTPTPSCSGVYTEAEKLAIEMNSEFIAKKENNYKEMNYTNGILTNISIYESDQKITKLFNKDLIYNSNEELERIELKRISDNKTIIKTINYNNGEVESISVSGSN